MNKPKNIPELRFPEFKEKCWNLKYLEQILNYERPDKYTVSNTNYGVSGIPVLTANKSFILGYTNDENGIYNNLPAIIFDDFTTSSKYVNFPFKVKSSAIKILTTKNETDNLKFVAELLSQLNFDARQHKRHYISVYQKLKVPFPEPKEQQKIAWCLSSLDKLIDLEQQKLEALKAHKKGLLQKLFPEKGKTVPEYRFQEFKGDGEWEMNKFSKHITLYRGSSPRPIREYLTKDKNGINWIKIGDTKNTNNFVLKQVDEKITAEGAKKSRRVNKGELILANSMSFGNTYLLEIDGCIYDGWFVLREYEKSYDKKFLLQFLNTNYMQKQYNRLSAGGIVKNISSNIIYQTKLPHTSIAEQQKIAKLLSAADKMIEAQGQKTEELKTHKKGLLQQLFPKSQ